MGIIFVLAFLPEKKGKKDETAFLGRIIPNISPLQAKGWHYNQNKYVSELWDRGQAFINEILNNIQLVLIQFQIQPVFVHVLETNMAG